MIKEFVWQGVPWRVREMDCRETPGARGDRCLVFESDEAARRVWEYPIQWRELDGESLGRIMDTHRQLRRVSSAGLYSTMSANIERAKALCGRLRTLLEEQRALVARRDELFGQCNELRGELRGTVERYGTSLRHNGTSPAGALALIQTFVGEAIGAEEPSATPSVDLASEGIAWGVAAYNDAA